MLHFVSQLDSKRICYVGLARSHWHVFICVVNVERSQAIICVSALGRQTVYLDVRVVHDQRGGHLQGQVVILPPVQHEGHTLLPHHLAQRQIWRQTEFRASEATVFVFSTGQSSSCVFLCSIMYTLDK